MESLLELLITELTGEKPISVIRQESDGITTFKVTAPKAHMGILIGKGGRMISAIRTLARTRGAKENIKVNVELAESEL